MKRQPRRGLWLWCNDDSGAIDVAAFGDLGGHRGTLDGCNWRRVSTHRVSNSGNVFALATIPTMLGMVAAAGMMGV